jgi:hypothetical protein
MAKGGFRAGAGRPKAQHTKQAEALKSYLIQQVIKEKDPLIQALITKAKSGDVPALKEVFERVLGKVKDTIDVNTKISLAEIISKFDD